MSSIISFIINKMKIYKMNHNKFYNNCKINKLKKYNN